jgi:hypothetical protein
MKINVAMPDTYSLRARIDAVVDRLAQILRRAAFTNEGVDVLRGAEGEAAQNYSLSLAT